MAARRSARPLYAEFLARVIEIEAVQAYRDAVIDDHTAHFFAAGRRPGLWGDFEWSLDAPEAFPWGPLAPAGSEEPTSLSPAMQRGWHAAVIAWRAFIAELVIGERIASGVDQISGVRRDLDPAEWTRAGLILDVRNGDLYEVYHGRRTLRWSSITLRTAKQPRQNKRRGHTYDWDGAWAYAKTLRAEDQWDWTQHRREKKQPLPAVRKIVEEKVQDWFAAKGSVPNMSDIRQNITIPLYAGRRTRGKRKR
jgi:hypothetical protein